jgi:hypothetical protein
MAGKTETNPSVLTMAKYTNIDILEFYVSPRLSKDPITRPEANSANCAQGQTIRQNIYMGRSEHCRGAAGVLLWATSLHFTADECRQGLIGYM